MQRGADRDGGNAGAVGDRQFTNFGSAGIMIGGMSAMAPQRKHDIVGLGLRSIVSGTLATCMSGAVVGLIA